MTTAFWDERRSVIRSRKGGWQIGKDVTIHGHSLFHELMGSVSWFQVWLLAITGRIPERRLADWCEAAWLCLSFPDPRIWCNQVSALAGTLRCTPAAATSAATLTSDALYYASWALFHAAEFMQDALRQTQRSLSVEQVVLHRPRNAVGCPQVPGFSRPIAIGDERVAVLDRLVDQYGLAIGEHVHLAGEIHTYLHEHHREQLNSGGYISAFLLDQGLNAEQIRQFMSMSVQAGALACYADTNVRAPESFLPLRCDDVDYQGSLPRRLSRD